MFMWYVSLDCKMSQHSALTSCKCQDTLVTRRQNRVEPRFQPINSGLVIEGEYSKAEYRDRFKLWITKNMLVLQFCNEVQNISQQLRLRYTCVASIVDFLNQGHKLTSLFVKLRYRQTHSSTKNPYVLYSLPFRVIGS